jgi:RNA polymerase sigma-70 factor (ECF subfamily)
MQNDGGETRPDEAELARAVAAARPGAAADAEAELYRRFAPRVRLYGLRHLREAHGADDLVQQVLLMTIECLRAGEVREPGRLGSFVLGMCRMVVLDRRRTGRRQASLLGEFAQDVPSGTADAGPRLDDERLLHCLERLPERERSVLVMTFYDERRAGEVAAELGLAEGNVRVIRHRAIERLRRCVTGGEGAR